MLIVLIENAAVFRIVFKYKSQRFKDKIHAFYILRNIFEIILIKF
jgi:hypothetical protein